MDTAELVSIVTENHKDVVRNLEKTAADLKMAEKVFDGRMLDIEQKMARRRDGLGSIETKSLGQLVLEDEGVKQLLLKKSAGLKTSVVFDTKSILSASGSWGSTGSVSTSLVVADRQGPVQMPMRQMTVRDLIAPGQTVSNAIEFAIQTARTNNAAPVAENTTKPYSNYTWDLRNFPVRTIAHMVKASRQILDDAPQLQSIIDSEMRYGLQLTEEGQVIAGDGTGQNLLGIIPQATAYSAAFSITGETLIDRLLMAQLQANLALYPVNGIVLHPSDWTKARLTKDGIGRYVLGDPQTVVQPMLWGLPVVPSLAMTAGTFLVGSFNYGAQLFDRMQIEVLISTENVDDFEKNLVSVRAEERLAFVVKRPGSFITGTLP